MFVSNSKSGRSRVYLNLTARIPAFIIKPRREKMFFVQCEEQSYIPDLNPCNPISDDVIHLHIFTFSKQSFNEPLDFCDRS